MTSPVAPPPPPMTAPAGQPDPYANVRAWQNYRDDIVERALTEQNAFNKLQLERQREDAEKALANAMNIAKLQAETSRYGTDQQTRVALARMQQDDAQFQANHGLNIAKAYTEYASTPDRLFMLNDLTEGLNRVGQGLGVQPYGSNGTPQPKTWESFAALSGFGNMPAVQAGGGGMPSGGGGNQAAAGGGGDPRQKAEMAILKAIPPSDGYGNSRDDFAALAAIENVRRASKPGSYERLRPGQQAAFRGGLSRLGLYAPDVIEDMRRSGIGQGSARQA